MSNLESNSDIIVFFPTNNVGKYNRYKESFDRLGIEYHRYLLDEIGNEIKVKVEEGENLEENAKRKAKAYYIEYKKYFPNKKIIIMSTDEALYFDDNVLNKINESRENKNKVGQPGPFVRRFDGLDGKRATDNEVVDKYTSIVKELGGEVEAKWIYDLGVFDGTEFRSYSWEEPVLFSDSPHYPITPGYVLNNITIVGKLNGNSNCADSNIMLSDLSNDARFEYLRNYTDFVVDFVIQKNNK